MKKQATPKDSTAQWAKSATSLKTLCGLQGSMECARRADIQQVCTSVTKLYVDGQCQF